MAFLHSLQNRPTCKEDVQHSFQCFTCNQSTALPTTEGQIWQGGEVSTFPHHSRLWKHLHVAFSTTAHYPQDKQGRNPKRKQRFRIANWTCTTTDNSTRRATWSSSRFFQVAVDVWDISSTLSCTQTHAVPVTGRTWSTSTVHTPRARRRRDRRSIARRATWSVSRLHCARSARARSLCCYGYKTDAERRRHAASAQDCRRADMHVDTVTVQPLHCTELT